MWVRKICVFNSGFLSALSRMRFGKWWARQGKDKCIYLFLNKFMVRVDPFAIACWAEFAGTNFSEKDLVML